LVHGRRRSPPDEPIRHEYRYSGGIIDLLKLG
jgi:hypothetical protein